jgi:2-polyprenyl-3-methyl-5-hydroxy-6-metoxy-1,4-benzoquinol methylase
LEDQAFDAGSFDMVTMSHVIEHVHDPAAVLRECRRILAPDGVLLLATPNARSWGHAVFRSGYVALAQLPQFDKVARAFSMT